MGMESREVRLVSRPEGMPGVENFEMATVTLAEPGAGEVQVRNEFLSVDPYMRGRMRDVPSYVPPFQLGQAMEGAAVGRVVKSEYEGLAVGDAVVSMYGWREGYTAAGKGLMKVDAGLLPVEDYLGVAGITGLTAYVGLLEVAKIQAGETVFVSAAAGAVGSVVCQMAKLKGCTVIGSAGGAAKGEYLRGIGVDAVIDYKAEKDLTAALRAAAPKGFHVYFENVGGSHLEAALAVAKPFARFAMCGMIEGYNGGGEPIGGLAYVVGKRLRLEGFIVSDHFGLMGQFLGEMVPWIKSGQVKAESTVEVGVDKAVGAFLGLFKGENVGKMLVKVG